MPQEPRTRRGFIRAAGLLAGGTAVAATAVPQARAAQVVPAAGGAGPGALNAGHARTLGALAETVSVLFPGLVPEPGGSAGSPASTAARYARLPVTERERVGRAIDALGHDLAALPQQARLARLGSRLSGTHAPDLEVALSLLAAGRTGVPPGDDGLLLDRERGRLLGRALRAATVAGAPAAPSEPISPFVV